MLQSQQEQVYMPVVLHPRQVLVYMLIVLVVVIMVYKPVVLVVVTMVYKLVVV